MYTFTRTVFFGMSSPAKINTKSSIARNRRMMCSIELCAQIAALEKNDALEQPVEWPAFGVVDDLRAGWRAARRSAACARHRRRRQRGGGRAGRGRGARAQHALLRLRVDQTLHEAACAVQKKWQQLWTLEQWEQNRNSSELQTRDQLE